MKFDIEAHKAQYHNYFEVVVSPEGEVEYARPSHQTYLIEKAKKNLHLNREELDKSCPTEYWFDYLRWLFIASGGYLPVWENYILDNVRVTQEQYATLRTLKLAGLYKGALPKVKIISRCPICGAKAKLSGVGEEDDKAYKYNCSNTALHIGCGDWYASEKEARKSWEKRCTGWGQPEHYRPTNEEHFKSVIAKSDIVAIRQSAEELARKTQDVSDEELIVWSRRRYVPNKCLHCMYQQQEYCVCDPATAKKKYLYIVCLEEPEIFGSGSQTSKEEYTWDEDEAFELLAGSRNMLRRRSSETGITEYWDMWTDQWKI